MDTSRQTAFAQEWVTLQNNHEQYERSALLIKLVTIVLFAIGAAWPHGTVLGANAFFAILCFVTGVLWAQEAILRTSQARLAERLLRIEALGRVAGDDTPAGVHAMQLHSEWQAARPGVPGLMREYAGNALRPTVAFPYAPLTVVLLALALCH